MEVSIGDFNVVVPALGIIIFSTFLCGSEKISPILSPFQILF
jgi:hypothetical protein